MIVIGEIIIGVFYQQRLIFPPWYKKDNKYGFSLKNSKTFIHKDYKINNKVILNKNGFRSFSETDSIELNKKTILFIGDSFTFGQGVNFEDTFAGKISNDYDSYQIVNASVPGWGPTQYEKVLSEYLSKNLKISSVVVGYFPYNDLWDSDRNYSRIKIFEGKMVIETAKLSFLKKLKIKLVHSSQILTLIYRLKISIEKSKTSLTIVQGSNFANLFLGDLKILREYGDSAQNKIIKIDKICKQNNIPLVVLVFSSEHGFTKRESPQEYDYLDYSFPTRVLTSDLRNLGINAIDFWPLMNEDCYLEQDAHHNVIGHNIIFNKLKIIMTNVL